MKQIKSNKKVDPDSKKGEKKTQNEEISLDTPIFGMSNEKYFCYLNSVV